MDVTHLNLISMSSLFESRSRYGYDGDIGDTKTGDIGYTYIRFLVYDIVVQLKSYL